MKNKPTTGPLLGILKPGEWHEFNDGKQFLHSISLMRVNSVINIVLLLENMEGKRSTLAFPATTNHTDNTEKERRLDAQF
jgi:hypothetical protein